MEHTTAIGTLDVNGRTAPLMLQTEGEFEGDCYLYMDWSGLFHLENYEDITTLLIDSWEEVPTAGDITASLEMLADNFRVALQEETTGENNAADLLSSISDEDLLWFQSVNRSNISWDLDDVEEE